MHLNLCSVFTFPIQNPESVVKIDSVSIPDALPPEYKVKSAFWDLMNEELDTVYQEQVDDFGTAFFPHLLERRADVACYFALQRADDPGIFQYKHANA